jgi:hypothetical protein
LEDTLVEHLAEDGFCLKLNGFGKFIVRHSPPRRRKIGFSGETREVPPKRKVKFFSLGKLRQLEKHKGSEVDSLRAFVCVGESGLRRCGDGHIELPF